MRRVASAVALALVAGSGSTFAAGGIALTEVERLLPSFELEGVDGQPWTPESLAGRTWVVNFWATWCPPCVEEMPAMNTAYEALEPAGVGMLAINAGEGRGAVKAFLDKVPIDFPVVLGDGATTLPNWEVRALPTTVIIDSDGAVVYEALGPRDWDDPALIERLARIADQGANAP